MSHSWWTLSLSKETEKRSNKFEDELDTETLGLTDRLSVVIWLGERQKPLRWQLHCLPKFCKSFSILRAYSLRPRSYITLNSWDQRTGITQFVLISWLQDSKQSLCLETLFALVHGGKGRGLRSPRVSQKWLNSREIETVSSGLFCFPRLAVIRQDLCYFCYICSCHLMEMPPPVPLITAAGELALTLKT
jgi:hypothetical protein